MTEAYLESALKDRGFSMKDFTQTLLKRKDEPPGDILDLLLGLSDFVDFKDMMLAYKKGCELFVLFLHL